MWNFSNYLWALQTGVRVIPWLLRPQTSTCTCAITAESCKCTYLWAISQRVRNKRVHSLNGNFEVIDRNICVLQLNYSNCNFATKIEELKITIHENKADIVILSESNIDTNNLELMTPRQTKFPEFKFKDKVTANIPKARVSIMVKNDL